MQSAEIQAQIPEAHAALLVQDSPKQDPSQVPSHPLLAPLHLPRQLGVQPQTFATPGLPPPQVCPDGQDPSQLIVPPQTLVMEPQLAPTGQVLVVHPHTFGVPGLPPPHGEHRPVK